MASLTISGVHKTYPNGAHILKGIDLAIEDGEFLILVGGSGCGKSTLLNMIAGLETVSEGEIRIGGAVVNQVAPKDRDIAMVFQSYALYPTMTVRENISFGLGIRKVARREQDEIVARVAETLQIAHLLERKPAMLSGGQRQRVAMGRAIARNPKLFLFDEPLSNLDAKLRVEMRAEIKLLHQRLGATIVYVTHDQVEAMTLGDKIAVMRDGVVQQFGAPQAIYDAPENMFVAGFIGSPSMNFLRGRMTAAGFPLEHDGRVTMLPLPQAAALDGRDVILGLRPEHVTDAGSGPAGAPQVAARIDLIEPTGPDTLAFTNLNGARVTCRTHPRAGARAGVNLPLAFDLAKAVLFDPTTEKRIAA